MRKLILLLSTVFLAGLLADGVYAKTSGRCAIVGKFKKIKLKKKFARCNIERSGGRRYLLIQILKKGGWLIDVSGIQDQLGEAELYVKAMGPGGFKGPKSKRYNGRVRVKIRTMKKMPKGRMAKIKTTLKSDDGKKLKINVSIAYTIDDGPTAIAGVGQFRFGTTTLKKFEGKFTPWHSGGFRLSKLSLVKPGESATVSVVIPRLATGVYTQKNKANLQLIHVPMVDGKIETNLYRCGECQVKVEKKGDEVKVLVNGTLKTGAGKTIKLEGAFAGRVEKK